jgi:hypothetical protein
LTTYLNFGANIETLILAGIIIAGVMGLFFFLKLDWKRYGLLFLLSAFVGNILCLIL